MEDDSKVAIFLREAENLAGQIAHSDITLDQYAETIDRLKEDVPKDRVVEVEVVFQLAAFKMEHEDVQTSEEIRQCYRVATRIAREVFDRLREAPLDGEQVD